MSDLAEFIRRGRRRVTPATVDVFRQQLPLLQVKMAEVNAPRQPHLWDQTEFLIRFVEDMADGMIRDYPYEMFAESLFALLYLLKEVDVIPDTISGSGYADDSAIVRYALHDFEPEFRRYAVENTIDWEKVTLAP